MPHVLIALENEPYPQDSRVRQEAAALTQAGHDVTVCAPGEAGQASDEHLDGVRVLRYPEPPPGDGIAGYVREYALALVALGRLMRRARRERPVDAVIVCVPPDVLVLPALGLRRGGAALIVDHHDLSPELFALKFGERPLVGRAVRGAERFALRRADVVMATNDTYAERERTRARIPAERIVVVRNGPDPARIHPVEPDERLRDGHRHLAVWAGVMGRHEGLGHALDAAERLRAERPDLDCGFALVGDGEAHDDLERDVRARGLEDVVRLPGRAGDAEMRAWLSSADVCLSVDEPDPMNDASTMTKVVEYLAAGRPVVQFPLRETAAVCGDASLYARSGDAADLAARIAELLDDPARAAALGRSARERALRGLMWPDQVPSLLEAVEAALARRASG